MHSVPDKIVPITEAPPRSGPALAGPIACVLCAIAGLAAFYPTLRHGFVYDDPRIVRDNWIVREPDAWYRFLLTSYWPPEMRTFRKMFRGDILYRPATIGSFRLEYLVHGGSPRAYHLVNLLLHAAASAAACAVAWRLWKDPVAGLLAGLLFASHPIHADAVAPIVGRSELLSAVCALWLLARHIRAGPMAGKPLLRFHIVSTLLFAAALFAKEHTVFVWPAVLLADWRQCRPRDGATRPELRELAGRIARRGHIGFAYACAAFFILRFQVFGWLYRKPLADQPSWSNPLVNADIWGWVLTPFRLLALTARLLVDPTALTPLWGPNGLMPPRGLREPDVWIGIALAAFLLIAMIAALWRRRPEAIPLVAFVSLMLLPLHVLPAATWYFAERWLYLPSAVLAIAVAGVARRARFWTAAGAVCLCLLLLPQTWSYAAAWRDDETLNRTVLRKQPDSFQAAKNLGVLLLREERYQEALDVGGDLAELFPDTWEPFEIQAKAYRALGEEDHAKAAEARRDRNQILPVVQERERSGRDARSESSR